MVATHDTKKQAKAKRHGKGGSAAAACVGTAATAMPMSVVAPTSGLRLGEDARRAEPAAATRMVWTERRTTRSDSRRE